MSSIWRSINLINLTPKYEIKLILKSISSPEMFYNLDNTIWENALLVIPLNIRSEENGKTK